MTQDNSKEQLQEQIEILVNLLALSVSAQASGMSEKASMLSRAGMAPKQIAALLGSTPNSVSVAISKQKRASKK